MFRFAHLAPLAKSFIHCRSGATAIEYGLIAALIAITMITGARSLGNALNSKFNAMGTKIGSGTVVN